jgi:hypothetical protein
MFTASSRNLGAENCVLQIAIWRSADILNHYRRKVLFFSVYCSADFFDLTRSVGEAFERCLPQRGSFTDTICDQSVITGCTITLMFAGTVGVVPGTLYVFLYTVVVLFAMVRNALKIPYSWLIRPRFGVYLWLLVEMYLWPGTIDYVLWGFNALLLIKKLTGFSQIRNRI